MRRLLLTLVVAGLTTLGLPASASADCFYVPGISVPGYYVPGEYIDGVYLPGYYVPGYYIPGTTECY